MLMYRRFTLVLSACTILVVLLVFRSREQITSSRIWKQMPQKVGLGDYFEDDDMYQIEREALEKSSLNITHEYKVDNTDIYGHLMNNQPGRFTPGNLKPAGSTYTKAIVMPHMSEDIRWLEEADLGAEIERFIYGMNDPHAKLRPPKNKGHEGMAYLTYIIDHYDELRDISIFMHPHQSAWHNSELLNHDALEMLTRLSSERVIREGYMNLRCHWHPGCPDWIRPGHINSHDEKPEENEIARAWSTLFPGEQIPNVLGSACCAQFALSRERIRSIPLRKYHIYRDWLLNTKIRDSISGRVFEYLWAKIFTDQSVFCPDQRVCYCDGYGVCFEDEKEFDNWFEIHWRRQDAEWQLELWNNKAEALAEARRKGENIDALKLEIPAVDEDVRLRAELDGFNGDLEKKRLAAIELGTDPQVRARIAGREWKDGDGF